MISGCYLGTLISFLMLMRSMGAETLITISLIGLKILLIIAT
jgi:hypothetical protein